MINFIMSVFFAFSRGPGMVQLEVTNRCNLSCGMCPRRSLNLNDEDMDLSVVRTVLEKKGCARQIILTGWGEPLLYPHLFDAIELCKGRGMAIGMTTNGSLLTSQTAKRLVKSGIDLVNISVDSFPPHEYDESRHNYPRIEEAINNLIQARGPNKNPKVILQPTLHKGKEDDVINVIKKGKELGVDRINIVRLDTRFNDELKRFSAQEEMDFCNKVMRISDALKIRVDLFPLTAFTGFLRLLYRVSYRIFSYFNGNEFCLKLRDYLYIRYDGKTSPCCNMRNFTVGNIFISTLGEIWRGASLAEFRRRQGKLCNDCYVYKMGGAVCGKAATRK